MDWSTVLNGIFIRSSSGKKKFRLFQGSNISWPPIPQFPACFTLDLADHFDIIGGNVPLSLSFRFERIQNMSITVKVIDSLKSLIKRSLSSEAFDYEGSKMKLYLDTPQSKFFALTLSQIIHLEADEGKNCINYPNKNFESFRECDENFVYHEINDNFNFMPFWAAKRADEITKIKFVSIL